MERIPAGRFVRAEARWTTGMNWIVICFAAFADFAIYGFFRKGQVGTIFNALRNYFVFCTRAQKRMVAMPSQAVDTACTGEDGGFFDDIGSDSDCGGD